MWPLPHRDRCRVVTGTRVRSKVARTLPIHKTSCGPHPAKARGLIEHFCAHGRAPDTMLSASSGEDHFSETPFRPQKERFMSDFSDRVNPSGQAALHVALAYTQVQRPCFDRGSFKCPWAPVLLVNRKTHGLLPWVTGRENERTDDAPEGTGPCAFCRRASMAPWIT